MVVQWLRQGGEWTIVGPRIEQEQILSGGSIGKMTMGKAILRRHGTWKGRVIRTIGTEKGTAGDET